MNHDSLILYQVILLHNDHVEEMLYDYPKWNQWIYELMKIKVNRKKNKALSKEEKKH
jgi:uncharacterized membrane protein